MFLVYLIDPGFKEPGYSYPNEYNRKKSDNTPAYQPDI